MSLQAKHFYEFGPFRLDPDERLLSRENQPVPLAPKVIDTLLVLVESRGHLVDKDELMKRVWPDAFVEEGSLNKNVSVLRKALGQWDGGQDYIETIPKRGYRFAAPVSHVPKAECAPGRLNPGIPAKLEEVISQTPEKDREVRCQSAAELKGDLKGWKRDADTGSGSPITTEDTPSYNLPPAKKFASGKKLALVLLVAVFLSVVATITWNNRQLSVPSVIDSVQITNDGVPKNLNFRLLSDGARVYFKESLPGGAAITQVSVGGGEADRLNLKLEEPMLHDISRTGTELLVTARGASTQRVGRPLWIVPLPAGPPRRVGDVFAQDACWAPDGLHLAFSNEHEIFLAQADGRDIRRLASTEGLLHSARFSPDGKRLRFSVFNQGSSYDDMTIFEMHLDGSGL